MYLYVYLHTHIFICIHMHLDIYCIRVPSWRWDAHTRWSEIQQPLSLHQDFSWFVRDGLVPFPLAFRTPGFVAGDCGIGSNRTILRASATCACVMDAMGKEDTQIQALRVFLRSLPVWVWRRVVDYRMRHKSRGIISGFAAFFVSGHQGRHQGIGSEDPVSVVGPGS